MRRTKVINHISHYNAAVITGGSSGIGEAFIETILQCNKELIVFNLSRSKPAEKKHSSRIIHIPTDLTERDNLSQLVPRLEEELRKSSPSGQILLINNSGAGAYGSFPEPSIERQLSLIDLNIRAVVELTARLLPMMKGRGGSIINIASTAAFQPCPQLSTYGATKAFVLSWSMALWEELRSSHVHVLTVCPGPTSTNFFKAAGFENRPLENVKGQTSAEVVDASLEALASGKPLLVSGSKNRWMARFSALSWLPLATKTKMAGSILRKVRAD